MIGSQSSPLQPFLDHWPKNMGRESLAAMLIKMTKFNDLTLVQVGLVSDSHQILVCSL